MGTEMSSSVSTEMSPEPSTASTFTIATTVEEAVAALAAGATVVAGGSDLVVGHRQGKAPLPDHLVAIDRVAELARIDRDDDGGLTIGAVVTHAQLVVDPTVVADYTALADGSALVGSPATRNVGTLGGNIMNGSPAMDTGAPLVVLGAVLELRSPGGTRSLPPAELWTGPGHSSAAADELLVACRLPARPERSGSAYVRLEYRRAMEIAVVGAAALVSLDEGGALSQLRVALTAVAPTIIEVGGLDDMAGRTIDAGVLDEVAARSRAAATPISDLRAGDQYRRHCVGVMAKRAVAAAAARAEGHTIAVPVNRSIGVGAAAMAGGTPLKGFTS
ncbi:MAG: FAD binding domain-containing protein [Acidimicrobiia bacterium]|nr:FAD binding domain-containing protein [Acidimicrobiia bacterium]